MKFITYEEWQEQIENVLYEAAKRQGLDHYDELPREELVYIQTRMAEEWINYKARTGQLILA